MGSTRYPPCVCSPSARMLFSMLSLMQYATLMSANRFDTRQLIMFGTCVALNARICGYS